MIDLIVSRTSLEAGRLVFGALARSVSTTQVRWIAPAAVDSTGSTTFCAIDPSAQTAAALLSCLRQKPGKLILFGVLPDNVMRHFGLQTADWPNAAADWSRSVAAPIHGCSESAAVIRYGSAAAPFLAENWSRPLERFDFADEWNNLGYGAIRSNARATWGLSLPARAAQANELAWLELGGAAQLTYCALFDDAHSSVLWFNRAAGPIDSFEWRLVERFLASWRHSELPCHPILHETPWGYDIAVTMRLDCDEDVESARPLWEAYQEMGVPFSLAVHTTNLDDIRHHRILQELAAAGGSILSHTATHAPDWGGSYEAALQEALNSARRLQDVTGVQVRYAVSPFHQSPPYALHALVDAGYQGCIGGIIRNDPEFLLARGGEIAGLPQGFIGHSQQCMLHGDCLLAADDPLTIFKSSFDRAFETQTMFGYLDHPFSERYQYGWPDETIRVNTHRQFIAHIRRQAAAPLFLSENDAMDFLLAKSLWRVYASADQFVVVPPDHTASPWIPTIEFAGVNSSAEDARWNS